MVPNEPDEERTSEPTPEQMALLVDVSRKINSRRDVDTILHKVVEYSLVLTGAERGFLFLAEGSQHLKVQVARDHEGNDILDEPVRISSGVVSTMLAHGIPIFLEDVRVNDSFGRRQSIMESGVRFVMGIPLKAKGRILGFIYVDNRKSSRQFRDRDRQILTSFADQAAIALENARLSREKREVMHEAALGKMSARLNDRLRETMREIMECRRLLGGGDVTRERVEALDGRLSDLVRVLDEDVQRFASFREFLEDDIHIRVETAVLDDVVQESLERVERDLAQHGIALHVSLNVSRGTMIDVLRVGRAVSAVLRNAVEAVRDSASPTIAVTTAPVPEGLLVEIRDNGHGIAPDRLDDVFDPFTGHGKEGGLGLGLAVARRIMEKHRGRVEIRSEVGVGTTVMMTFPSDLRPSMFPRPPRPSEPPGPPRR